ncbi:MAG: peptidase S10 [Verrucomicrobiota bacterium]|jgi:carboxypeptidase C (cathepsin A)
MLKGFLLSLCLLACGAPFRLIAANEPAKPAEKPAVEPGKEAAKPAEPKEELIKSQHTVTINGQKLDYTAVAGTILLRDNEDKPTAAIFYIAYTKDGVPDLGRRPITFSFNGGPGSSSVWLHLGLLGPRRVLLKEDGSSLPPPYQLVDNEFSLLDETDLVFIDPVSTGFSRAVKPDDAKKFHGVESDLRSVAGFIRLYTTRNTRWGSPKFIIGESYGTTRAAGLTGELRERQRMNVNGIMLVSTVLNFETISFARGNDLAYVLYLPSYTAAAWYHQKLPPDLQRLSLAEVIAKAENFAAGDYNHALLLGTALPAETRRATVKELARLTGLSEEFIDRANLRVAMNRFAAELLRAENRVIGRFDARFKGYVRDRLAGNMEYDPTTEAVASVFASTFNHYVRAELNYKSDLPYEILSSLDWDWGEQNRFLNVAETLADSLTRNPYLRVHVSIGDYDLATPWLAVRYTFNHLQMDPDLAKNVTLDTYTAGHMMYLNLPDLKKQKADLARFIRDAAAPK